MEPAARKILVVGGNGFIGSAVCKAALNRGYKVASVSSSGRPFRTPKGHSPAWTSKVDWHVGDAFKPETYAHLLPEASAVVHTLGTLLEDVSYKRALSTGNILGAVGGFLRGFASNRNPLESETPGSYEALNRDSALHVAQAFLNSTPNVPLPHPRPFIYISAEDIFRPIIPSRYIETKREAEAAIARMMLDKPSHRAVYIRPSLVYHPHFRPYTSPVAALLDLSAVVHAKIPAQIPTPSSVLRTISPIFPTGTSSHIRSSPLDSVANALTLPPIHVDHVAEAICIAVDNEREDVKGVYGVKEMRRLIGWERKGASRTLTEHNV
ncbi:mitochondrial protein [Amylostereum chailletii]|nr:mitochondrial protein [Amylostereum chailletii]